MHYILTIAPFILLMVSIVLLWLPRIRKYWFAANCAANLIAFWVGIIHVMGIIANIGLIYAIYYYYENTKKEKLPIWLLILVVGLLYLCHYVPGVSNLLLIENINYDESVRFDFWLNFDKILLGLLILAFSQVRLVKSFKEYWGLVKSIKYELSSLIVILIVSGLGVGFIKFSPKLPIESVAWALHNLFSTAIAEEAFFRLFLQTSLIAFLLTNHDKFSSVWSLINKGLSTIGINTLKLKKYESNYEVALLSIILVSLFYGLTAYKGGAGCVLLTFIAGLFYGWSYYKTAKIEAAITVHFTINFMHYLFFTFPAAS